MKKIFEKIKYDLIPNNSKVGIALSGGADSVFLLFAILAVAKEKNLEVIGINLDHSIRENSKVDSDFVKELCKNQGVMCKFKKVQAKEFSSINKMSLEEGARVLRYEFFNELKNSGVVDIIAIGHHMNDNVETILLNIFKGASLTGVSGIAEKHNGFIRPMMEVERCEIEEYVRGNNIDFVTDESNFSCDYERNYIRNEVIPCIENKFPQMKKSITNFAKLAKRDDEYLNAQAENIVKIQGNPYIMLSDMDQEPIATRGVKIAMKMLGVEKNVYGVNYKDVLNLAKNMENGSRVDIVSNISCYRDYDRITFQKRTETNNIIEIPLNIGNYELGNAKIAIKTQEKFEIIANSTYLDFDKLPKNAIIRFRRIGDVFQRTKGTVSLKEYFIDKKIPARTRDNILVVASGSEIFAVIGYECGVKCFIDSGTSNIVSITVDNADTQE